MNGKAVASALLFYLLTCALPVLIDADCTVPASEDSKSKEVLKRLDPIKGKKFTFTYKDGEDNDKYEYHFAICTELKLGSNAGLIQNDLADGNGKLPIVGRINETSIKAGTDWIMLTYKGGDKYHTHCQKTRRKAHIMITCNPNLSAGRFAVLYEENKSETEDCFYLMELESSVACSNSSQGLSTGSIVLIVFACFVFVYISLGMLYKRCVHGSKGIEQVPNIGFWRACGNLQADGCDFLCRCQESGYDSSRPYRGIADDQLDEEADDEHLLPM